MKQPVVYILTNQKRGTLYIGVTSDLIGRVYQHKNGLSDGFSKKYGLKRLVWYEIFADMISAIEREKQMKKWKRDWKIELIEKSNPNWDDLYDDLF